MTMNPKLEEARKFLDKEDDGTKVFEVEWTQTVTWTIAAASQEEAEKAAKEIATRDLEFDDPDVFVSTDRTEWTKNHREKYRKQVGQEIKPPDPDSGVFKGEIVHINEYFALRVWHLICDRMGNDMRCPACGHEDWTSAFNLNPEPPKYGHIPIMGCPECQHRLDWVQLVSKQEKQESDESLPLFGEEGEGDGANTAE